MTRLTTRFPILLTLFAFALRVWRIDSQSLRGDEAFDVLFATQPLGEIIYQLRFNQIYPPLYHTLDHFWFGLAGTSQIDVRFLSLCAGVLLVPVAYRLARHLFDERTARVAAILVAVHPFLIWHSQDGKMYSVLALAVTLMTWCALRVWRQAPRARLSLSVLAAYAAAATFAIMTHYFAYVAVFGLNVAPLALCWQQRWPLRVYARWFAANALVGVLAAGWIALAWSRFSTHTADWITPTEPLDVLRRTMLAYSLGTTIEWDRALPFLFVFAAVLLVGVWRAGRSFALSATSTSDPHHASLATSDARSPSTFILLLLLLLPVVLIYFGSLWRPMYDEKFLIFIVPYYMILIARGLLALGRLQPLGNAVIVVGMMLSLYNYQFEPRFAKSPPWRETAQAILAEARPGDLVVYNNPDPSLPYQLGSVLPIMLLPGEGPYEAGATPLDTASTERELAALNAQYARVWFIPQPAFNWDKDGAVGRWLGRFADRDASISFGSLALERYLTPRGYQSLSTPLGVQFADHIRLTAYRIATLSQPGPAAVSLILYWQAQAAPSKDYTVFAHLLNQAGTLVAQTDNPPVRGTYPTSQWHSAESIVDRYDIIMPGSLPPGIYRFEVGLYDAVGVRLRAGDDDKVVFGEIQK